jgi:HYR domain
MRSKEKRMRKLSALVMLMLASVVWLNVTESASARAETSTDTTPPDLVLPGTLTMEATMPSGALVPIDVGAVDDVDPTPVIECSHGPGLVLFPRGTTRVACSARDSSGNESTGGFDVVVADMTPPVITVPATTTVDATSPAGAEVSVFAFAVDEIDADSISMSCSFGVNNRVTYPIGTTTLACTAMDTSGNSATASFDVAVLGPRAQTSDLRAVVQRLILPSGTVSALTAKLKDAVAAESAGDTARACSALGDFVSLVQAQSGKKIRSLDAAKLIEDATRIGTVLGC